MIARSQQGAGTGAWVTRVYTKRSFHRDLGAEAGAIREKNSGDTPQERSSDRSYFNLTIFETVPVFWATGAAEEQRCDGKSEEKAAGGFHYWALIIPNL